MAGDAWLGVRRVVMITAYLVESEGTIIEMPCPGCGEWLEVQAGCDIPEPPENWCETCDDHAFFDDAYYDYWTAGKDHYEWPGLLVVNGPFRMSLRSLRP